MSSSTSQRLIENDERKLSYYVFGDENSVRSLFFLNGLYHGHNTWIKQRRYSFFSENYKLIFMDYRGLGDSVEKKKNNMTFDSLTKDINLIMDKEEISKTNIVAYSVGGMIALWYAHMFQERIDKLILLNTSVRVSLHGFKMIEGLIKLVEEGATLENIFSMIYPWNHSDEYLEKIGYIERDICKNYALYNKDISSLFALLRAVRDRVDISPFLKDIIVPTLLIGSDEDVLFPVSCQSEIVTQMKNCSYKVIRNCGHASFVEKYPEINLLIEEFLKESKNHG